MSRINSKLKGSSFERTVANLLTESLDPISFQRNSMSGSFLGGKNSVRIKDFSEAKAETLLGDVYSSNNNIKFVIECKNYNIQIPFHRLFSDECEIYKWFSEASTDSEKLNKKPLLIFKLNRTKIFFVMNSEDLGSVNFNTVKLINGLEMGELTDLLQNYNYEWWLEK